MQALIPVLVIVIAIVGVLAGLNSQHQNRPPKYWRCTANHNHRTPDAARRCSSKQP